jgi:hypothetical protein
MVALPEGVTMLDTLETISIGGPVSRGPITLYPLYAHGEAAPHYLTGPEAAGTQTLVVEEVPSATVATLVATIKGQLPVLLVEGEAFLGGLQDRILNTSVLLGIGCTEVPVSCVEAGRWRDGHGFARAGWQAPRGVRSTLNASVTESARHDHARYSDQGAVWAEVDRTLDARDAASPTAALREAMIERGSGAGVVHKAAAQLGELCPLPHQTGVVAAVGSRLVMAELFDKATTLQAYWAELLAGLADDTHIPAGRPPHIDTALRWVRRLGHADRLALDGVGLGRETRFTRAGQVGSMLEWKGALVHLTTYAVAA